MCRASLVVVGMSLTAGAACGGGGAAPDGGPSPDSVSPAAHYEIRVQPLMIADGHTEVPVLVIGTNPDGTPAHGDVVLNADRAGAGSYTDPLVTLGDLGATTSFVPCNSTIAGCVGGLTLTMALASDPTNPVAHVDTMLGPPAEVGSVTECLAGGNIMHFLGNDFIFNGDMTVDAAAFGAEGDARRVQLGVNPDDPAQGMNWALIFETRLMNIDMVPSVYDQAQRVGLEADGHPGLEITGNGNACSLISGAFQVHDYQQMFGFVDSVTISFEQHCENSTTTMLTGCIHYQRNP